jgi:hypothetical protein
VRVFDVKGFERVGCVGKAVDEVRGARISAFVSRAIGLQSGSPTLYLDIGVRVQLCGRGLSFLNALLILIIAIYFVSFLVD